MPGFWKEKKIRAGGRMTFGTGVSVPSVILPPASRSWASATLISGSHDRGVVAAMSILQGVRGSNHSQAVLWFPALTTSCKEGGRQIKNIAIKKIIV